MKLKALLSTLFVMSSIAFVACDDDLNTVGDSIQPGGDEASLIADSVTITAETVSFEDKVYARTAYGTLGQYNDKILGAVKSDFLCEFYVSPEFTFKDRLASIDSVSVSVLFNGTKSGYIGDSTAVMGISAYKVVNDLTKAYYTNVDPAQYCDFSQPAIASTAYSVKGIPIVSSVRAIMLKLDTVDMGRRIYNEWLADKTIFNTPSDFKRVVKGLYIANTYGSGSLINVEQTYLNIYYSYIGRNTADTADSIRTSGISFPVTPDVIQLNKVENSKAGIDKLTDPAITDKAYVKTPAGVYTKINIPIGQIAKKRDEGYKLLNSASFTLKGYTEIEQDMGLSSPTLLLCVPQDSLANYFEKNKTPSVDPTSMIIQRTASSNSYSFGNMASYIDYYITKMTENGATIAADAQLTYCIIPVEAQTSSSSSSYTCIYHTMKPTGAVFRTDEKNMKMSIIQSKFNK